MGRVIFILPIKINECLWCFPNIFGNFTHAKGTTIMNERRQEGQFARPFVNWDVAYFIIKAMCSESGLGNARSGVQMGGDSG